MAVRNTYLLATAAAAALATTASAAFAGGFEVREQSTYFQGTSWAGAAAGGHLSSMFWNGAALGEAGPGITTNSNYALIIPRSDITATGVGVDGVFAGPFAGRDNTVDIGRDAIVPASYAAIRISPATVFGVSINSQFGLGTKPDNLNWVGQLHGRTAELFSMQVTPTVAHEIMPGVIVSAGIQLQYLDLKRFKSALAAPAGAPTANLHANDVGAGFTAGILFKPAPGTSIGVGYRSTIHHDVEGGLSVPGNMFLARAEIDLPEKVTASIRQSLGENLRVMGTVEWTNWSRLGVIPVQVVAPVPQPVLDFQWDDGWLYSLGAEYDVNAKLQLRAGVAYEKSPIQDPTARLVALPDADRIWASIGASYKWSDTMTFDIGYSHVFVDDSKLIRSNSTNTAPLLFADVESSVDIISVGLTMKLGGGAPAAAPLK